MEKKWRLWPGDNCPKCGDEVEIFTASDEDGLGYDGDTARCVECKYDKGYLSVEALDSCFINWVEF